MDKQILNWTKFSERVPAHNTPLLVKINGVTQWITYELDYDSSDNHLLVPHFNNNEIELHSDELNYVEWIYVESLK